MISMARQWTGGHSGTVLCVGAAGGPDGLLASGGEGGEVTIWSQEGGRLSTVRLQGQDDVTCLVFSSASPGALYASHGGTVSTLDPRDLKAPVCELRVGEDEINALSLNDTGALLAAADDSGSVCVVDLAEHQISRTLRRHTNICSSLAFRPNRPDSLVSAGLDMQVMLWNVNKARPLWTVNLQDTEEDRALSHTSGQLLNPPLAHCISVASCGNVVACAAEDGRVHLLRVGAGSRPESMGALRAHSLAVSQAHFLNFLSHPYWLATGGNDARVSLWDLGEAVGGTASTQAPRRKRRGRRGAGAGAKAQAQADTPDEKAGGSTERASASSPGPSLSFDHGDKVNWLCPAALKGEPCLLVADQSSTITVYSLSGPQADQANGVTL
uniref:WD repeat domain 53 n=1 Tax=Paramormyrops kingsleyae TaxID=1676925 RepID=A0A3B3SEL8_9TELE